MTLIPDTFPYIHNFKKTPQLSKRYKCKKHGVLTIKSMVSWSTAITTFQCSAASFLPIPHLSVPHTAYFKLTKIINFICFKLQIHTNISVCKTYILYIHKFRERAIVSQHIIHQCSALASPPQGNPWETRVKRGTTSYENGCQEACKSFGGVLGS